MGGQKWYEMPKVVYDYQRSDNKYRNHALQLIIKGMLGESSSKSLLQSYCDNSGEVGGYAPSLSDLLREKVQSNGRFVVPIIQARRYWLGQRAHATLLCVEKTDQGVTATYYDPKSNFLYDVSHIAREVRAAFAKVSFSVEYLGVQSFYNDTECGMHVAQMAVDFVTNDKDKPVGSHKRITPADRLKQYHALPEDIKIAHTKAGPQGWSAKGFWRHYKTPILMTAALVGLVLAAATVLVLTQGLALPFIAVALAKLQLGISGALGVSVAAGLVGSAGAAAVVVPVATYSAFGACLFGGKQVQVQDQGPSVGSESAGLTDDDFEVVEAPHRPRKLAQNQ